MIFILLFAGAPARSANSFHIFFILIACIIKEITHNKLDYLHN